MCVVMGFWTVCVDVIYYVPIFAWENNESPITSTLEPVQECFFIFFIFFKSHVKNVFLGCVGTVRVHSRCSSEIQYSESIILAKYIYYSVTRFYR